MFWFYLISGLFLGWSLGANDAANVFGTAVATKMVKFKVAALVASVFVIIGATISGAGAAHTLGKLGSVNALGGAFTVALAAAITVAWMTKLGLPVSTTQAIVGAIVGWDFFAGTLVDTNALRKIVTTWVLNPILAGLFSYLLFKLVKAYLRGAKIHLLRIDLYTRLGLILIGAFGAYSLGANNIANVMGVFVASNPFTDINFMGVFRLTATQVLFFIGGLAIATGIYTYSYRVMKTVGSDIFKLSPVAALIVVLAESLVLFIFASQSLERLLIRLGLPTIPLVPVSSSQAVVGGVIGIAFARGGGKAINFKVLSRIFWGWIITPVTAAVISFFTLFFMQNVFQQQVYEPIPHKISHKVVAKLQALGLKDSSVQKFEGKIYYNAWKLRADLKRATALSGQDIDRVITYSQVDSLLIDSTIAQKSLDPNWFTPAQIEAVKALHGSIFEYHWELVDTLSKMTPEWSYRPKTRENRLYNKDLKAKYERLFFVFKLSRIRQLEKEGAEPSNIGK